jgi:hypothetical protein
MRSYDSLNCDIVRFSKLNIPIERCLISNLKTEKDKVLHHNFDFCMLITGEERSGKTTLGSVIGYYLGWNPKTEVSNFNLNWYIYSLEELEEAVDKAKPNQVLLIDEFVLSGFSGDAMTEGQKRLKKLFVTCGYKNLFFIFLVPSIWLIGAYFAKHRTRYMIHTYLNKDGVGRGMYRGYNKSEKNFLYNKFKDQESLKNAKYSFIGYSPVKSIAELGFNVEEYERRKIEAISKIYDDKEKKTKKTEAFSKVLYLLKQKMPELTFKDFHKDIDCGLPLTTLKRYYELGEQSVDKTNDVKPLKLLMPHEIKKEETIV